MDAINQAVAAVLAKAEELNSFDRNWYNQRHLLGGFDECVAENFMFSLGIRTDYPIQSRVAGALFIAECMKHEGSDALRSLVNYVVSGAKNAPADADWRRRPEDAVVIQILENAISS